MKKVFKELQSMMVLPLGGGFGRRVTVVLAPTLTNVKPGCRRSAERSSPIVG
ncbi:MAG: hypothetical protein LBQ97_01610 [Fusobacteriaceae bacterium]|jgi:hypothetical protein|nr:hypothetical protein [Fusobacteriaceae bacterium]